MSVCSNLYGGTVEEVAVRLKRDIQIRGLRGGSKLLPLRKLAEQYEVSYLIVQKAVKLLCGEGFLSSRQGSGVFVSEQDTDTFSSLPVESDKKVIAVTFCGMEKYVLAMPVYNRLLHGIEKEAARQGFEIVISLLREPEAFCKTETYSKSHGFLLIGNNSNHLASCFKGKSVVCVMGANKKWGDHVTYGNRNVGVLAADELVARGHKYLVSINAHEGHGEERCRAFNEHARGLGAEVLYLNNPAALVNSRFEQHIEFSALDEWVHQIMDAQPRPTGAFVVDLVAHPLCNLLTERGMKLGRDIEIITSHWHSPIATGTPYQPINIEQHPEEIGALAVRQLQWRMQNPGARRLVIKVDPEICAVD